MTTLQAMHPYLICGDIGGTKTLLRAVGTGSHTSEPHLEKRYDSCAYSSFDEVLDDFLRHLSTLPQAICLAIAGPVVNQQVTLTNLDWHVSAEHIQKQFSIPAVSILNDFEAVAHAIAVLRDEDQVTLQTGSPQPSTTRVVLGAGTGMGVAWLVNRDNQTIILPTEAGHIDFAPVNPLQVALLDYLSACYGHVSVERILSGQGLVDLFHFLQQHFVRSGQTSAQRVVINDAAMVTHLAFEEQHPVALQVIEHFCEIYGAYAGNLALAGLCHGGVYIAGGIAPRILQILQQPGFIRAFQSKGRFRALLQTIPVHIIINSKVGLLGAELIANQMMQSTAENNPQ